MEPNNRTVQSNQPDSRKVFVVHGRNLALRDSMFTFLRALGLQPIEWAQAIELTSKASPYIGEILDAAFSAAQAVVVLFTPDEITYLRSEYADGEDDPETEPAAQARPNVLFEAGMAMGRDSSRTILLEVGRVRRFSDVVGRHVIRLDSSARARHDLANRLRSAGCSVDTSGADWLSVGDFTPPSEPGHGLPIGKRVPPVRSARRLKIDLRYHSGVGNSDRLEIVNQGTEELRDINLELPAEARGFELLANELPLRRLPAGKSVALIASRTMASRSSYFDVKVTGRALDGEPFAEEVFLSLRG